MTTSFRTLRAAAGARWSAYVDHDFVARLGDGTLPESAFLHYLRQDYVFLVHFSRAWALAATKTDRIDELRHAAATVHALIHHEMPLHIETCAARGISESELAATAEEPENIAYTRFVIDAGLRGDLLDLLVAMMPCVMGYAEIGTTLHRRNGDALSRNPYAAWIETYAGHEYQQVASEAEHLLERVAARLIGPDITLSPRYNDLCRTFAQACDLERDFWRMGLRGGQPDA
jgi:thiaminase/transcriptional activator TenA